MRRREGSINIGRQEKKWHSVGRVNLVLVKNKWHSLVNSVMKLWILQNSRNFLSFSERTLSVILDVQSR